MQNIEQAWKEFFKQFTDNVFTENEYIEDTEYKHFPRITFSYQIGDYFDNTLATFQVWTYSFNNAQLFHICDKIAKAIPVESGANIEINTDETYEYKHPVTGAWIMFELSEFDDIAAQFPNDVIEWRKNAGKSVGAIEVWRGNPFMTPSPKDEPMLRVSYGTLQARYLNTV